MSTKARHTLTLLLTLGMSAGATAQMHGMSPPAFADFDLNGDGLIQQAEFIEARGNRIRQRALEGRRMQGLNQAQDFTKLDLNGDGLLNPDEFARARKQHRKPVSR